MKNIYLVIISAILMGFSQQPWGFGFLAWFSLVPFLFFLEKEFRIKNIIIYSFIWSFIYHLIFFYWLSQNIGLDSQLLRYLTLLTVIIVLSINILLIYVCYYFFRKYIKRCSAIYILPFLITSIEYLRSLGFYGSAWNSLAYSQSDYLIIAQNIEYTGMFALTFWIVLVNVSIYQLIHDINRKNIILLSLFFLFPWFTGLIIKSCYNDNFSKLNIKVIQPNVSLKEKRTNIMKSLNHMIELSSQTSNDSVSLIVWPESSIYKGFADNNQYNNRLSPSMTKFLKNNQHFSLVAGLDLSVDNKKYNAAVLFNSDSIINIYRKQRLVPHVEHTPEIFDKFGLNFVPMGFDIGTENTMFNITDINFASMICIESVFANPTREFVQQGAEFIVYIVNDGWYPGNPQLEQHSKRCIYRSIENRRSVVRCANTGVSMIVDPYGNITNKLEFNKSDVIESEVLLSGKKTFYTKYGDLFSIFNLIALLYLIASELFRKFYNTKK